MKSSQVRSLIAYSSVFFIFSTTNPREEDEKFCSKLLRIYFIVEKIMKSFLQDFMIELAKVKDLNITVTTMIL